MQRQETREMQTPFSHRLSNIPPPRPLGRTHAKPHLFQVGGRGGDDDGRRKKKVEKRKQLPGKAEAGLFIICYVCSCSPPSPHVPALC